MPYGITLEAAYAASGLCSSIFGIILLTAWRALPGERAFVFWGTACLLNGARFAGLLAGLEGSIVGGCASDILAALVGLFATAGGTEIARVRLPLRPALAAFGAIGAFLLVRRYFELPAAWADLAMMALSVPLNVLLALLCLTRFRDERRVHLIVMAVSLTCVSVALLLSAFTERDSALGISLVLVRPVFLIAMVASMVLLIQGRVTDRLEAEIAERARAERRFEDMVETASDWHWEIDRNFRFTFISEQITEMSGIAVADYIGRPLNEINPSSVPTDEWRTLRQTLADCAPFKNVQFRTRRVGHTPPVYYTISGKPLFDETGRFIGYRGTGRNVTKETETAEVLHAVLGGVGNVVGPNYLRALVSHTATSLLADFVLVSALDATKSRAKTLALWQDGALVANREYDLPGTPCAHVLAAGVCVHASGVADLYPEDRMLRELGIESYVGAVLLDVAKAPIGLLVVLSRSEVRNIEVARTVVAALAPRAAAELERQINDERLRASEQRLRNVIDKLPVGVILKRGRRFEMVNSTIAHWCGLTVQAMEAMEDDEFHARAGWGPDTRRVLRKAQHEVARTGRTVTREHQVVLPDGKVRDYIHSTFPIGNDGDGISTLGLALTDVTELRRLQTNLAQAQKMDALGRLAGGIAHDFNNILGAISGFANFIATDAAKGTSTYQYAARILTAATRAKLLIERILAFTRQRTITRQRVQLRNVFDEVGGLLQTTIPRTTKLGFPTIPPALEIDADPTQIIQVLLNICVNANDALAEQPGHVNVTVEMHRGHESAAASSGIIEDSDGTVHSVVGAAELGKLYVRIRIRDTGTGMSRATLERVFDPFFTTKSEGKGTGLGMSVVHGIVLAHDGAIAVTSRLGTGTTIDVWLPAAEGDKTMIGGPASDRAPQHKGRVLVIDDDDHFGDMIGVSLRRIGYHTSVINRPIEAVATFEKDPSVWDLVITDQSMPGLTGVQVIAKIREKSAGIPSVLCTGFAHPTTEVSAQEAGADAYLTKPVDPSDLARIVAQLIEA